MKTDDALDYWPTPPTTRHGSGFTLIELLVVISIVAVLAALVIPNVFASMDAAKRSTDGQNLRDLLHTYMGGQARQLPTPQIDGNQFWLALYVGDGVVSNARDAYLSPGLAGLVVSPANGLKNPLEVQVAIEGAKAGGGLATLQPDLCDYAGPLASVISNPDRIENAVVGATGVAPNGMSFFAAGFNVVHGSQRVEWISYVYAAAEWGWPSTATAPDWAYQELQTVIWQGP